MPKTTTATSTPIKSKRKRRNGKCANPVNQLIRQQRNKPLTPQYQGKNERLSVPVLGELRLQLEEHSRAINKSLAATAVDLIMEAFEYRSLLNRLDTCNTGVTSKILLGKIVDTAIEQLSN